MNTRRQIAIDRYVAKPLAFLLNFLVRIVGKVLSIDHNLNKDFKTIAICKFKGMGSIVQSTPMIKAIRNRFPDAEIIYVSTAANEQLLKKIDLVDTIITLDDKTLLRFLLSNIKALIQLIRKRPDVYFDLEIYADYSTLFTLFTLSKNRIGFYLRSSSFRMGIYTHMMFFNPRVPISKVYLQMAGLAGCTNGETALYPLHKATTQPEIENPYIVINPNASDLRLERRWDKKNFIRLIQKILDRLPEYDIVLIGSKGEKAYTAQIAGEFTNERVKNSAGSTNIDQLIGIIANANAMVTNDTGPMHIAFSTQTPVVCLFGPCSPEQYELSEYAHVIYKKVYCSPCVHDFEVPPCNGNNVCMQLISVDEVFNALQNTLNEPKSQNHHLPSGYFYGKDDAVLGKVNR